MKPDYAHIEQLEREVLTPEDYDLDHRIDEAVSEAREKRHNKEWKENRGVIDLAAVKHAAATVYPVVSASASNNYVHIQQEPYANVQLVNDAIGLIRDHTYTLLYGARQET